MSLERATLSGCIVVVLVFSVLRFHRLEQKYFWFDEMETALYVRGHIASPHNSSLPAESIRNLGDLRRCADLTSLSTTASTLHLLVSNPKHTPLYFVLAHAWARLVGVSPARLRLLSAVCSVLTTVCIYWLALLLFESRGVALVAASLDALSPFKLIYAQQAREYSLWMMMLALSCGLLLRALRRSDMASWVQYGTVLTLCLYVHLLTFLMVPVHAMAAAFPQGRFCARSGRAFLLTCGTAVLLFAPWMAVIAKGGHSLHPVLDYRGPLAPVFQQEIEQKLQWDFPRFPPPGLRRVLMQLLLNASRTLLDTGQRTGDLLKPGASLPYCSIPLLIIGAALFLFPRAASKPQKIFLLSLLLVPLVLFVCGIAVLSAEIQGRYLSPCWLALGLMLACTVHRGLSSDMRRTRALSGLVLVLLAVGGGVSHYAYFQETVWWTTPHTQAVNLPLLQGDRLRSPLVMALPMLDNYLPLSYSLDPATPVILLREDEAFLLPRDQSAYLYMPPPWLLSQVRKMNGLMVMELGRDLWRVTTARDATPG